MFRFFFKGTLLVIFVLIADIHLVAADCALLTALNQQFELLRKIATPAEANLQIGMAEVDVSSCLDAAEAIYRSLAVTDDDRQKHLASGMLALIAARRAVLRGDRSPAALRAITRDYQEWPVYLRALADLTSLLDSQPAAPEWQFLAAELTQMGSLEDPSGQSADAVAHLALHDIRTGHLEQGLTAMEQYLSKPRSVQIRLRGSILYLELLLEGGRYADARILTRDIDTDVGEMELDPNLRLRFLQAAAKAYSTPNVPENRLRYQRYASAVEQARKELQ
ncbi:MAG: hypothetical protein LAO55_04160 [Acidobacteriia bacterium]|nr:hypothetical protein [Terriglobia bacterium]